MEDSAPMFARAVRVLVVGALVAAVAVPACGGSSNDSSGSAAGSGGSAGKGSAGSSGSSGSGGSAVANTPVSCGKSMCDGAVLSFSGSSFPIPGCCADENSGQCGLDSSFLAMFGPTFDVACQPLNQPGSVDKTCGASTPSPVPGSTLMITFPGCCHPDGTCGYELNNIGGLPSLHLGLGCVDSTPFLDGGTPAKCGGAQAGAGGEGPTGSAGASTSGGAGGETASGGAAGN